MQLEVIFFSALSNNQISLFVNHFTKYKYLVSFKSFGHFDLYNLIYVIINYAFQYLNVEYFLPSD